MARGYLEVDETAEREVDLFDFLKVDVFADASEFVDFLVGEDLLHVLAQAVPGAAVEVEIGAGVSVASHVAHCAKDNGVVGLQGVVCLLLRVMIAYDPLN